MPRLGISRTLPYRPEQLFDIAADVESYPEFLPWWHSATIRYRNGEIYYTDQVVGFGPITQSFTSKTVLRRPEEIEVTSIGGPFEAFELIWRFGSRPHERCEVTLSGEIELRAPLLGRLLGSVVADGARSILSAFEDRARRLYGMERDETTTPAT
jgi:coenzyme Q-binding protein COQ10